MCTYSLGWIALAHGHEPSPTEGDRVMSFAIDPQGQPITLEDFAVSIGEGQ